MIGHYAYNEPHPTYARYQLPGLNPNNDQNVSIKIIGKMEFIPVKNPSDYLGIGNIPALKEIMSAIKKAENEPDSVQANRIIASGTVLAEAMLDKELEHYLGSGRVVGVTVVGSSVGQNDPVPNLW